MEFQTDDYSLVSFGIIDRKVIIASLIEEITKGSNHCIRSNEVTKKVAINLPTYLHSLGRQ